MDVKLSYVIVSSLAVIGMACVWGVIVAGAAGKEPPALFCTVVGMVVGGLSTALAHLVKRPEYDNPKP